MQDIVEKINLQLDDIALKYNLNSQTNKKTYTLNQTIQLLNKLDNSSKTNKTNKTEKLDDLINILQIELFEKNNIDHLLNQIINCANNETYETITRCSQSIQNIIDNNFLQSNIKNKLNELIKLLIDQKNLRINSP